MRDSSFCPLHYYCQHGRRATERERDRDKFNIKTCSLTEFSLVKTKGGLLYFIRKTFNNKNTNNKIDNFVILVNLSYNVCGIAFLRLLLRVRIILLHVASPSV